MKPIKVSAPGKLHILGEHAVVYGKPAIIAAVDKRCFATISERKDKKIEIVSHSRIFTQKEILQKTENAQRQWKTYAKTSDISLLKSITANPLDYIVISIGETISYLKKTLPSGFTLSIQSDIPIGSGMGSSAALAVSVAGAISILLTKKIDKKAVNEIAFLCEQKKHGFPSGGDNSASCFGGLVWYRKETPDLKIIKPIPFALPEKLAKKFSAVHTGIPVESTGEMVSIVKNLYQKKPELVESILSSQEKLVRELLSAIKNSDEALMIRIIRAGERNLERLGVVSKFSKSIIREIEASDGAAKICGGGGIKHGTGILLTCHRDKKTIKKVADNFKLVYLDLILGGEGVRMEK